VPFVLGHLTGGATSVPFTGVLSGPERTATDNAEVAPTWAIRSLCSSRSCSIWLCKQGGQRGLSRPSNRAALGAFSRLLKVVCWQSAGKWSFGRGSGTGLCWWA
jgi:hypothetical protein